MQKLFQLSFFLHFFQFSLPTIRKNHLENQTMRIDKFLNAVNITKRRSIAQDMISNKVVLINDVVAKASKGVDVGSIITINYLESSKKYQVLKIPTTKSTPKSLQDEYIKEIA